MGKGLATAIMGLILPTYILLYNWSPDTGGSLLVLQVFGVFYVFAFYSVSGAGSNSDGTGFRIFDPNWYLNLDAYLNDRSYSSNAETAAAESYADHGIFAVYGNYKDYMDGNTAEIALGASGILMAFFLILLLLGIILNIIGQQKGSGILFMFAGAAALGALFLVWGMLYSMDQIGGAFFTAPGDKYVPIPFGAILVILAGLRAMLARPDYE